MPAAKSNNQAKYVELAVEDLRTRRGRRRRGAPDQENRRQNRDLLDKVDIAGFA